VVNPTPAVPTAADLAHSPVWFPLEAAGPSTIRFVSLDEAAYRAASFLDQRLLHAAPAQALLDTALAQQAAAQLTPRLHYVFHIGHVGSTLVSRLLGAQESFFCLREPALLRVLADGAAPVLPLPSLLALLARTWRPSQHAVVKVSSFVSELAQPLLQGSAAPRAIFMYAAPLTYLRTIFAGPNSRTESRALAPLRLRRLVRRLGGGSWRFDPRSEGEQVAMSWLAEMSCLHQAARQHPTQILWLDFDRFLTEPRQPLERVFAVLGAPQPSARVEALLAGPIMRSYSKAPEYGYDARLRRELLQAADRDHAAEIRRGLAWLGSLAQQYPEVVSVLQSAEASGLGTGQP
jgi:hypothetical protein